MTYYNYHPDGSQATSGEIFVFGSNLAGVHGAGAARAAVDHYGAEWGKGEGIAGRSYALPTKDEQISTLPIEDVESAVNRFVNYAWGTPDIDFFLTRIGCGLAGFVDAEIAPFFVSAPRNINFPLEWAPFVEPALDALTGMVRYDPLLEGELLKAWGVEAEAAVVRLCIDLYETRLRLARAAKGK